MMVRQRREPDSLPTSSQVQELKDVVEEIRFGMKQLIEANMPPPSDDTMIFVCGPPPMYNALCGPRDQKELTGALAEMGYTAEMVYKF